MGYGFKPMCYIIHREIEESLYAHYSQANYGINITVVCSQVKLVDFDNHVNVQWNNKGH